MGTYLYEVSYTADAWAKQVKHPSNRMEAVRPVIEAAGGKVVNAWFAFGDSDIILVVDLPSNEAAAALSLAFTSGGALANIKTTVLMSIEDGLGAIKKAGTLAGGYKPPA